MIQPYLSSLPKDKANLMASWEAVDTIILATGHQRRSTAELLSYCVYHYSAYTVFGRELDNSRAKELLDQALARLTDNALPAELPALLDQAMPLAWLHARLPESTSARAAAGLLLIIDQHLLAEAARVLQHREAGSRTEFLRIIRYFYLRPAAQLLPTCWPQLVQLLGQTMNDKETGFWFPFTYGPPVAQDRENDLRLGLADGLAGQLLLLMRLATDHQLPDLREQVRLGILYILSTKREVDFSEKKYAIFPDQIAVNENEATFSNELSWRSGDLAQALLLYNGHALLQDAELQHLAELVGLNTLLRTDVRSTAVTTSLLNSGAAGVAHLYRKLYAVSGHEAYRKGYVQWLAQTRSWLAHEDSADTRPHDETTLLSGPVGVGLVLLSAVGEQELGWDNILL